MDIRQIITLIEAAHLFGATFWFNPVNNEVIPCGDHGDCVEQNPQHFGIDQEIVWEMEAASSPPESERDDNSEDEADAEPDYADDDGEQTLHSPVKGLWGISDRGGSWHVNDAWEQLAMNNGWVRVGVGRNGEYATYLSSSNARAVWLAANYLNRQGSLTDKLEIEVSRPENALFIYLADVMIDQFLRAGARGAEGFLVRLDRS